MKYIMKGLGEDPFLVKSPYICGVACLPGYPKGKCYGGNVTLMIFLLY